MEEKKAAAKRGEREYSDDDESDETQSIPKDVRDSYIRSDWQSGKFTQDELAEKYGIKQGTVSKIVNNDA